MRTHLGVALVATALAIGAGAAAPARAETLQMLGETVTIKVDGDAKTGRPALAEVVTPPGMGPPLHRHSREDETFYVLEGTYRLWHGDATHDVTAGEAVFMERNVVHTYKNVGTTPGRLLVVITPAGFENFFREVARRKLGPADGPALAELGASYGLEFLGPPK